MIKNIKYIVLTSIMLLSASFVNAQTTKYKCMIQMQNYTGKEAYLVISLINPQGQYDKTLAVLGDDQEWYNTIKEWDKFRKKKKEKLNGITGASVAAGSRATRVLEFETNKLNKGYSLRFESAVETQKYYVKDAEIPLTSAILDNKEGVKAEGYIRLIRFVKVQ